MKANWFAVACIVVVMAVGVSAWPDARAVLWQQTHTPQRSGDGYGHTKIKFSDTAVTAEVPLSAELQAKGLGGRTGLSEHAGMVWMYPTAGRYSFWMKDMLIPLDFIWIDQGRVVDITPSVPAPAAGEPESSLQILEPAAPASIVLEVSSGFAQRHRIAVGDPVEVQELP